MPPFISLRQQAATSMASSYLSMPEPQKRFRELSCEQRFGGTVFHIPLGVSIARRCLFIIIYH